jgi:hypothetical protein
MDVANDNQHTPEPSNDYTPLFLISWFFFPGIIQGFLWHWLFLSDQSYIENKGHLFSIGLFVFLFPLIVYLSVEKVHRWKPLVFGFALALLCAVLAYLSFEQFGLRDLSKKPLGVDDSWPFASSIAASFVIVAIAVPFFRTATQRHHGLTHYPSLFEFAWQQFVVVCFAVLFVLLVLGVLLLATKLLDAVGATFMEQIWEPEIMFPAVFASGALGMGITRQQPHIVKTTSQLFIGLLNVIQPLHLLLTLLFLGYVVFTGFQTLNDGRFISSVLMFTVALGLTLCTAAVGYEEKQKKSLFSNLWKLMALATLLVSMLSLWLVWQRLDQYGPTHLYLVVALLLLIGFVHAVGYCISLFPNSNAIKVIGRTNIVGALLALLIAIAAQLPWFNLVDYSVRNQLARIQAAGEPVDISKLRWMQRMAGQAGNNAIDQLYAQNAIELPVRAALYRRGRGGTESELSAKQQLAPLYESGSLKLIIPNSGLTETQQDNLEEYLVAQRLFKHNCITELNDCRVYIDVEMTDASVYALIVNKSAPQQLGISWAFLNANDGWSPRGADNAYLRRTELTMTSEQIDAFYNSLDSGVLPLTTVSVPAVTIGEKQINPLYGEMR